MRRRFDAGMLSLWRMTLQKSVVYLCVHVPVSVVCVVENYCVAHEGRFDRYCKFDMRLIGQSQIIDYHAGNRPCVISRRSIGCISNGKYSRRAIQH